MPGRSLHISYNYQFCSSFKERSDLSYSPSASVSSPNLNRHCSSAQQLNFPFDLTNKLALSMSETIVTLESWLCSRKVSAASFVDKVLEQSTLEWAGGRHVGPYESTVKRECSRIHRVRGTHRAHDSQTDLGNTVQNVSSFCLHMNFGETLLRHRH